MTRSSHRFAAAAAIATLAACTGPEPAADPANDQRPDAVADTASLAGAGGSQAIAARFVGRWDAGTAACAGAPGEMRIEIEPDRIRFHESVARVEAARPGEGDGVELDLAFEGEGETWRETRTLRLLPGDLLEIEVGGASVTRVRCQAPADQSDF
ncbi:MAG: hypothetical protein ACXWUP_06180 [Allosphingosinicella sp.]